MVPSATRSSTASSSRVDESFRVTSRRSVASRSRCRVSPYSRALLTEVASCWQKSSRWATPRRVMGRRLRLVVGAHHPDRAALHEQGDHGEAPGAQDRVALPPRRQRRHPGELLVVRHHEGDAGLPHRLEAADLPQGNEAGYVRPDVAARDQPERGAVGLGEPDVEALEVERAARRLCEDLDALLQVHRAVHRLGQGVEILGEPPPILDVLEEAGLGDRGGGLGDEDVQHLVVVHRHPERCAPAHHQHAEQQVLEDDRHAEEAAEAVGLPPLPVGHARIRRHVVDLEGTAMGSDPAHVALAQIERAPGKVGHPVRAREGTRVEALEGRVDDPHRDHRHLHQLDRGGRDPGQHLVRLERRGHELVEPGQGPQTARPRVQRVVQPGVAQEDAGLLADRLQRGQVRILEAPPRPPPHQVERARDLAVEEERDDQARLVREATEEVDGEPRVGRQVVAPDDLAAPEHRVEPVLVGRGQLGPGQRLERVLGHVVGGHRAELGAVGLPDVGRDRLRAGQPGQLPADEPQGLEKIGGRAGHARDRQQGGGLAQSRFEPVVALDGTGAGLISRAARARAAGAVALHGVSSSICRRPANTANQRAPGRSGPARVSARPA